MSVKYAIVGTNDNTMYCNFWPVVRQLWINHIGIKPVLACITNKNDIIECDEYIIHKIKSVPGIDTGLQSQIARLFVTQYYMKDHCLISDIDMLPINRQFFKEFIKDNERDCLIIHGADAYKNKKQSRYPMCYVAGLGKLFCDVLDINSSFNQFISKLKKYDWGWDTDELYMSKMIDEYHDQNKIIKKNRGWKPNGVAYNRIDRVEWCYNIDSLRNGEYIDCHSIRPYTQYKHEIDQLVSYIM